MRIVANAGGLNPAGLADGAARARRPARPRPSVAHVEGDDLRRADELGRARARAAPLTANAYLGAFGHRRVPRGRRRRRGHRAGHRRLAGGRARRPRTSAGRRDDYDALAGAVVAGHVLECGAQATGGNFAFFAELPDDGCHPGFPLAEIAADGSASSPSTPAPAARSPSTP